MPTITVSAVDSATAMDQILSQLGDDALILDTKTRDGKVEISATNDLGYAPKKKDKISDVFTKVMEEELHSTRPYSNPMTGRPSMDKATSDAFMKALEEDTGKGARKGIGTDDPVEDEAQINIRVKRLKWENERLAKDVESQRSDIQASVETAKVFYEKALEQGEKVLEQGEDTKQKMHALTHDLDGLRQTVHAMQGNMVSRARHRFTMLALVAVISLSAGTFAMRDQLAGLTPFLSGLMQTIGIMPAATTDQIEISALDATRMGDTIRIKGMVTNHNQSMIEAPLIRFQVKDKSGAVLVERDVMLDQPNLKPSVSVAVTTQLVMTANMADDEETEIVAIPMFKSAPDNV
jgi:flagellar biosynthesis GTPase FlhF